MRLPARDSPATVTNKMIFPIILVSIFTLYLVAEERERRAANPNAEPWLGRVRKSGRRKGWFFLGILAGAVVQLARKKDPTEILVFGAIAFVLLVFAVLHEATLEMPRKNKDG